MLSAVHFVVLPDAAPPERWQARVMYSQCDGGHVKSIMVSKIVEFAARNYPQHYDDFSG